MSLKRIKNANSLSALSRAFSEASATLHADVNKITQDVAKYAIKRYIYETPIDTSQAISNWRVGVIVGMSGTLPAYFIGENGTTFAQSSATALGAAYQQIARKKYGAALVLYNNVTYINKLNAGASTQADANFVEQIEADAQNYADALLRGYLNGD